MSRRPRERGQPKVLVIDDEPDLLELLELTLSRMGLDTTRAQSVAEAIRLLDAQAFDLCLTDMRLPDGEGLRVVEHITEKGLDVPVAVITAFGSAENAVAALKAGAFDYLAKPVALEQLRALVKQALKVPEKPAAPSSYQLLGESQAIMQVRQMIDRLSKSQAPVFITGESGSGKELAARMIRATHKKLTALVEAGEFRQDLFYRLHVIELAMPSLREMREDIPSIADALLHKMSRAAPAKLDAEAAAALESYPFPGNVRELENVLERGLSLAADPQKITADDLHLTPPPEEIDAALPTGDKWPLQDYLDRVERAAINEALDKTRYNRTAAAKLLGITFRAMRYRMERLGIK